MIQALWYRLLAVTLLCISLIASLLCILLITGLLCILLIAGLLRAVAGSIVLGALFPGTWWLTLIAAFLLWRLRLTAVLSGIQFVLIAVGYPFARVPGLCGVIQKILSESFEFLLVRAGKLTR